MTICYTFSNKIEFSKWMGYVQSNTKLSKMSIPGTHESISYDPSDVLFPQKMNVTSQLISGIRFIDIGIQIDPDNPNVFKIHSDRQNNNINLRGVLEIIKSFLKRLFRVLLTTSFYIIICDIQYDPCQKFSFGLGRL